MSLTCARCDRYYIKESNAKNYLINNCSICKDCDKDSSLKNSLKLKDNLKSIPIKGWEEKRNNLSSLETETNNYSNEKSESTNRETNLFLNTRYDSDDLRKYRTVSFSYINKMNIINNNKLIKKVKAKKVVKPKPINEMVKNEGIFKETEIEKLIEKPDLIKEYEEKHLFYLFVYYFINNFIYTEKTMNPFSYHLIRSFRILIIFIFCVMSIYFKIILRIFIFACLFNLTFRALHQENMKQVLSETLRIR